MPIVSLLPFPKEKLLLTIRKKSLLVGMNGQQSAKTLVLTCLTL
jgi:hypothetical protein